MGEKGNFTGGVEHSKLPGVPHFGSSASEASWDKGPGAGGGDWAKGPGDQNFADQGQGALNEDTMGSAQNRDTTDIEAERSQGRESDIEGSSL